MPRVKQNDTDTWRLVQVDDALWLMPKAPHSPLLTHCIADSIALNKGDWIALRSGDKSQVHSVASNSLQLVSSFGELASIVLLTPAEHFTVLSVWRPSWVVGWGRKPEGAYALANSIRGEAHDFRLIENSGFVSDLLLASDRVELETLLAERREWEGKFGSFLLLKLLNRNPLDEVWLAERFAGATRQRVALKLLRESIKRDGEQLFNHQRAVTSLEHPCIARVIDTGDEKGVTWIAVEHVQGEAITGWCDYHSVSVKKRVQMFLHVLDAVRVGHTHLVVHSDLRSPNILVDNHGMPKLLNFGYGKQLLAANKVSFFSFCPPSPEQFSGENTVATDIYQLGALLYELLSGSVPFSYHGASPDLIRELVLHRMPAIPSIAGTEQAARVRGLKTGKQLGLVLKGDLDRIVLRALHKNPSERYRTTLDFSHELIAWLNQRSEKW